MYHVVETRTNQQTFWHGPYTLTEAECERAEIEEQEGDRLETIEIVPCDSECDHEWQDLA